MKRVFVVLVMLSWPVATLGQPHIVAGIRISIAPPAPRWESPPAAPAPRYVWVPGYWAWQGNQYAWVAGHWALPPPGGYVWEPPRWEKQGDAWMFYEGYWRPIDSPDPAQAYQPPPPPLQPEVAQAAPPPPIVEVRPAVPFPGAVWLDGYWHWNGFRFVWVAGRWSPPPAGFTWEGHRWDRREDGRWEHRQGHWHPAERHR